MTPDEQADVDALLRISAHLRRLRLRPATPAEQTALSDALGLALDLIENYASDVRAGIADGRVSAGFCQGRIYREILPHLAHVLEKGDAP